MKLAFKMFVNCQSGGGTISHGPPGREKRSGRTVSHGGPFCMEHLFEKSGIAAIIASYFIQNKIVHILLLGLPMHHIFLNNLV